MPSRPKKTAHPRRTDWEHIKFASSVPANARQVIETLFFFNPRQPRLANAIEAAIALTGQPHIQQANDRVWLATPNGLTQCLFACDNRVQDCPPVGVALYFRPASDVISIAHLAIRASYTLNAHTGQVGLGTHLIGQIELIARRIRGVTRVELPYLPGCYLPVTRQ